MGGYGSGRYGGRPTADASLKIDLAWMFRSGYAREGEHRAGSIDWTRQGEPSGSIGYQAIMSEPGAERLELSYGRGSGDAREQVRQTVRLCFTVPHHGGKRWWMLCPFRHIRVAKLYLPPGGDRFASRQAWRLGYQCQREAVRDRPLERLFRLQYKLGAKRGLGAFPSRPKGMWHRTYERHLERYWELEEAASREFLAFANRLIRLDRSIL
ncbi:hypothetical protein [Novosphingobium sp. CECT 9465]|uniref:hypothetical protein n=1 Tax=Novosphingobium sp. CECT 9465 TaxID=2829794 RepID=UPI001E5AA555|nr:hypothetical protein [Novosphingobium sp. CECT 9465]CAH0496090.1 hypothetical protein NVSP9465_01118 [Novosphingobium sp. CECT 9465]